YRMNPGDDVQGAVAANYAYAIGKRKILVFYNPKQPYSNSLAQVFSMIFLEHHIKVDLEPIVKANSSDFQQYVQAMSIDQPDMIFCACFSSGTAPDFSVLYHDLQSYPELRNVTLMGGDGLYTPQGNDAQNH